MKWGQRCKFKVVFHRRVIFPRVNVTCKLLFNLAQLLHLRVAFHRVYSIYAHKNYPIAEIHP